MNFQVNIWRLNMMIATSFKHALACVLAATLLSSHAALAELDQESKEGLEKTQQLLRNKSQRDGAIKGNADAQRNDAELQKMLGPSDTEGVYNLSADIFGKLVEDAKGDPVKLQQLVDEAAKNPEKFLNSLSPDQKARIKNMADQAEKRSPTNKP